MAADPGDLLRLRRWQDFRRRVEFAPQKVYRHREAGWEYIPIHPFGDEPEVLANLGMGPEGCVGADAWWGIERDATLLQSWVVRVAHRPAGLYARRTEDEEGWVDLTAVLDAPFVTRTAFETAMSEFAAIGFPGGERFLLRPEQGTVRLPN
jgi:hypothetical protein